MNLKYLGSKNATMVKKVKELVIKKVGNGNSCDIEYKGKNKVTGFGGVKDFIFAKGSDGWTLYQGCELVIGDTTIDYCVFAMLRICGELI